MTRARLPARPPACSDLLTLDATVQRQRAPETKLEFRIVHLNVAFSLLVVFVFDVNVVTIWNPAFVGSMRHCRIRANKKLDLAMKQARSNMSGRHTYYFHDVTGCPNLHDKLVWKPFQLQKGNSDISVS